MNASKLSGVSPYVCFVFRWFWVVWAVAVFCGSSSDALAQTFYVSGNAGPSALHKVGPDGGVSLSVALPAYGAITGPAFDSGGTSTSQPVT